MGSEFSDKVEISFGEAVGIYFQDSGVETSLILNTVPQADHIITGLLVNNSEVMGRKCDHRKQTITIINDKSGSIFGGYLEKPWRSSSGNCFVSDDNCFVFSLKRGDGPVKPQKHESTRDTLDVKINNNTHMLHFFGGAIVIPATGCNKTAVSTSEFKDFSRCYREWQSNLTESPFQVAEIEVFEVSFVDRTDKESPRTERSLAAAGLHDANTELLVSPGGAGSPLQETAQLNLKVQQHCMHLVRVDFALQQEVEAFRDELRFVAHHLGTCVPVVLSAPGLSRDKFDVALSEITRTIKHLAATQKHDASLP
eukprot:gene37438-46186_t